MTSAFFLLVVKNYGVLYREPYSMFTHDSSGDTAKLYDPILPLFKSLITDVKGVDELLAGLNFII